MVSVGLSRQLITARRLDYEYSSTSYHPRLQPFQPRVIESLSLQPNNAGVEREHLPNFDICEMKLTLCSNWQPSAQSCAYSARVVFHSSLEALCCTRCSFVTFIKSLRKESSSVYDVVVVPSATVSTAMKRETSTCGATLNPCMMS